MSREYVGRDVAGLLKRLAASGVTCGLTFDAERVWIWVNDVGGYPGPVVNESGKKELFEDILTYTVERAERLARERSPAIVMESSAKGIERPKLDKQTGVWAKDGVVRTVESTSGPVITNNVAYGNKAYQQGLVAGALDSTSPDIGFDKTINPQLRMDPYAPTGIASSKRIVRRKTFDNRHSEKMYIPAAIDFINSLAPDDVINVVECKWAEDVWAVVVWYWEAAIGYR